ncbi:MAG: hypothetical protein H6837_15155 [Planctomycetes bacterium]|nr:hypothetical protein [Planctomycetota bacterium]
MVQPPAGSRVERQRRFTGFDDRILALYARRIAEFGDVSFAGFEGTLDQIQQVVDNWKGGSAMSGRCFVMQPFDDGGPFDKRYEQVLAPAIREADLESYRVDHDPGCAVPIGEIEEGIRNSKVCVADITTDNVNVAFELGYALALKKRVVLIGKKGTNIPFDYRHRKVIFYDTDAPGDFKAFTGKVTAALMAALEKAEKTERIADALQPTAGFKAHEVAALAAIAQIVDGPGDSASMFMIRETMEKMGYTKTAATLALAVLLREGLVSQSTDQDHNGGLFVVYSIEDAGMNWLLSNQDHLELRVEKPSAPDFGDIPF